MTHSVYVIRLSEKVWDEKRFRDRNPDYRPGKPMVYVGMTGRTPQERFEQHLNGYRSSKYAKNYGLRLMPRLYEKLNCMPFDIAVLMEKELAERLQRKGYAAWWN